jgi:hypothetical protein
MAGNFADAIEPALDLGGAISFPIKGIIEESGQTFLYGMPVMINGTDGGVQIWNATVGAGGLIAGIACQNAQNLGTTGAGAPVGFSPILGVGSTIGSFAANSTQSLAVIAPPMVPMTDGYSYFYIASPTTVFKAKYGTTNNPTATTNQLVGTQIGMTKDTGNNFWYADAGKTGASAVLTIVGLDPLDPVGTVGGHVLFTFIYTDVGIFA